MFDGVLHGCVEGGCTMILEGSYSSPSLGAAGNV